MICDKDGMIRDRPEDIEKAFLDVCQELLGRQSKNRTHVNSRVVKKGNLVGCDDRDALCKPFTCLEVKEAIWQIGGNKAPGPDGYGS